MPLLVARAEQFLGVQLSASYLEVLAQQNGGDLARRCLPTAGEDGIDGETFGSRYLVAEWGYPNIGVVIGTTPSVGHDTVMRDYSESGPGGEAVGRVHR